MKITVDQKRCKKCKICVTFCPKKVLEINEQGYPQAVHIDACIGCQLCTMRCPDFAIQVEE